MRWVPWVFLKGYESGIVPYVVWREVIDEVQSRDISIGGVESYFRKGTNGVGKNKACGQEHKGWSKVREKAGRRKGVVG